LLEVEAYFYLNKITCYLKLEFAIRKLIHGAEDWWFEFLEDKACIVTYNFIMTNFEKIINLELVQDDYEEILY